MDDLPDEEDDIPHVGLILPEGFDVWSYTPLAVFGLVNTIVGKNAYDVDVMSESGGRILSSFGMAAWTQNLKREPFDTIIVGASRSIVQIPETLEEYLTSAVSSTRRIASIGTAAFQLGACGILDCRRATTHWAHANELQARYPAIRVEVDRIFVVDGSIWTSAGMAAGIDLILAFIEQDMGPEVAHETAKTLVLHHRRRGGQSQHTALPALEQKFDRVQNALAFARENLKDALSVERLAEAARLSPRQFSRIFRAETGLSPAKAVEGLRLDAARLMSELSRAPI